MQKMKNKKHKKFVQAPKQTKCKRYFEIFQVKIRVLKSKLNLFSRVANHEIHELLCIHFFNSFSLVEFRKQTWPLMHYYELVVWSGRI